MTELSVIPAKKDAASTETLPLEFETAGYLAVGETPSSVSIVLVDADSDVPYPAGLSGPPVVSGTKIRQTVTGLQKGRRYWLRGTFTASAGKRESFQLLLD